MHKTLTIVTVTVIAALLIFSCDFPGSDPDILVVINGLEFVKTVPAELMETIGFNISIGGNREDYLKPALIPLLGSAYDIRTFDWSGDASQTGAILSDVGEGSLRNLLRSSYLEARSRGAKFAVLAHSWGTFLGYMALALESGGPDPVECDLLITLSSPIAANHAGSIVCPLDAAVEYYANEWMEDLSFDIGGSRYPRAKRFLNYWAWGDFISGPLAARIPAAAKVRDIQIDFFGVADATSLKRGFDDVSFWHNFTSLRADAAENTGYPASEGFGADAASLVSAFRSEIAGELLRDSSHPPFSLQGKKLRLQLSSVQCIKQPEWSKNSEYYGFFRIQRAGVTFSARRWYEDGDLLSAWLRQGEVRSINWTRDVPVTRGVMTDISLNTAFFEDDYGGDGNPGTGSVNFLFDGNVCSCSGSTAVINANTTGSGFFDIGWSDGDREYNIMRVNWTATLVD